MKYLDKIKLIILRNTNKILDRTPHTPHAFQTFQTAIKCYQKSKGLSKYSVHNEDQKTTTIKL